MDLGVESPIYLYISLSLYIYIYIYIYIFIHILCMYVYTKVRQTRPNFSELSLLLISKSRVSGGEVSPSTVPKKPGVCYR